MSGGTGWAEPGPSDEQRARLAARLAMPARDRSDAGQALGATSAALALGEGADNGAARLEALAAALADERVVVPVAVEPGPGTDGHHAEGRNSALTGPVAFERAPTPAGPAIAVYSSAAALSAHRPGARPMGMDFRTVALAALVETGGRAVMDPGGGGRPRPGGPGAAARAGRGAARAPPRARAPRLPACGRRAPLLRGGGGHPGHRRDRRLRGRTGPAGDSGGGPRRDRQDPAPRRRRR